MLVLINMSLTTQPFVSIIVPVYNGASVIRANIESLLNQTYPIDRYEIIIVDNGSTDETAAIARSYPRVVVCEESTIQGSYAARNKALEIARGEIIAFTDVDCIAHQAWIEEGVRCLVEQNADAVGGSIQFIFSDNPTASEQWDSLVSLNNEATIRNKGVAVTANLFVNKVLFGTIGAFRSDLRSGGDFEWTARATRSGHSLVYCDAAIVSHPARGFVELMKKSRRVGSGALATWKAQGRPTWWVLCAICSYFVPIVWIFALRTLSLSRRPGIRYKYIQILFVAYITKLMTLWGIMSFVKRR